MTNFFIISEKVERASKPLRFELKTKTKSKNVVQKSKTVEVFNETEEQEEDLDSFAEDELDGYRPNLAKKEKTPMEKAQIAMEQAKRMIAEVQQKQMLLKENAIFKGSDFSMFYCSASLKGIERESLFHMVFRHLLLQILVH